MALGRSAPALEFDFDILYDPIKTRDEILVPSEHCRNLADDNQVRH